MSAKNLPAVHDDDLERLLDSVGLGPALRRGEVSCRFCGEPLTLEELGAIFPAHGNVYAVCSQTECIQMLVRDRDEARHG